MKNQIKYCLTILVLSILISFNSIAQKGTVKIFSELKGISVYLDEEFKGVEITTIDSVSIGSHYLKITKDNIIVFGELIEVKSLETTTVLLKDTKEVQDKLLASKYNEQQEYKSKKMDVMLSTSYVTETTGQSNSIYFPGYYSVVGASKSNSISVTTSVTDWFFVKGQSKISEYEFAKLVNNQNLVDMYNIYNAKQNKTSNALMGVGAIIGVAGFSSLLIGLLNKNGKYISTDANIALIVSGIVAELFGYALVSVADKSTPMARQYSIENAIKEVNTYNLNLKKSLGLPQEYEPK